MNALEKIVDTAVDIVYYQFVKCGRSAVVA